MSNCDYTAANCLSKAGLAEERAPSSFVKWENNPVYLLSLYEDQVGQ